MTNPDLSIHESDISSELCQTCAACCTIKLQVAGTNSRYRKFLRTTGFKVEPVPAEGMDDCCEEQHDITINMGPCKHLKSVEVSTGRRFLCELHGSSRFPRLCAEYNCVSWAKARNNYTNANDLLMAAQKAFDLFNV